MNKSYSEYRAEDVLYELEAQRGLSEKHFQMADGSMLAVSYPCPVHYPTEGGFKDIDNTLKPDQDGRYFHNAAGFADIRLAAGLNTGDMAVEIPLEASLADGVYQGSVRTESLKPISLLLQ